ncbi:MAG: hypothetical protein V2A77_05545 [Pseudomonadota bacterium]
MAWLHTFLAVLFAVHCVVFLRLWLRGRRRRHLYLIGTFSTLSAIYALKCCGILGPCRLALNPEMGLRAAAVSFSTAAIVGYVRERRSRDKG